MTSPDPRLSEKTEGHREDSGLCCRDWSKLGAPDGGGGRKDLPPHFLREHPLPTL